MNEQPIQSAPEPYPKASRSMKQSAVIGIAIAVLIIGGGGGFYSGMQYEKQTLKKNPQQLFTANGIGSARQFPGGNTNRAFRGGAFGGGVRGTIASVSGTSMTVTLADGSSKIVIVPSSATISKSTSATSTDLTTGQTVLVTGTANSDGSTTAENIQLNPVTPANPPTATPGAGV